MMNNIPSTPSSLDMQQIIDSAHRLGIEMDESEALQWLAAMVAHQANGEIIVDVRRGVFGHKVVMLDFSPHELDHFRKLGRLVEIEDQPGAVETALALSGSSAQSKIQTYPGDADFFERVNILASTREQACQILADLMREKALSTFKGPTYQLIEVKFGDYPYDVIKDGRLFQAGTPVSWNANEVQSGQIDITKTDGAQVTIHWDDVKSDPGWCKFDWVVADTARNQLANASNMLDVTWEAPNGDIIPLDGYLDPYFQEVYLEATSIPIFAKLAQHVSADALDEYVEQLEKEVKKYLQKDHANYGKAAKRMYNIFRLTGRYHEAAFLRELFDEPAVMLYQVWSLIRTIDDCCATPGTISRDEILSQADELIISVTQALEGDQEVAIIRQLLRLRDSLSRQTSDHELSAESETARAQVINIVNNFFYERLTALPTIRAYMEEMKGE